MDKLLLLFRCWVLDRHKVEGDTVNGPYKGIGDGYDLFGVCCHCKKMITKDTHWTGDSEWRRVRAH